MPPTDPDWPSCSDLNLQLEVWSVFQIMLKEWRINKNKSSTWLEILSSRLFHEKFSLFTKTETEIPETEIIKYFYWVNKMILVCDPVEKKYFHEFFKISFLIFFIIERSKNPHLLNDSSKRDTKSFSSTRLLMNIASAPFLNLKAKNSKMLPRMDLIG